MHFNSEAQFQSHLIRKLSGAPFPYTVLKLDPGTGNIPVGFPDLIILQPGGVITFAEVKLDNGKVTLMQRLTLLSLIDAGFRACILTPSSPNPRPMTREEINEHELNI